MKGRKWILILVVVILFSGTAAIAAAGKRPFKNLNAQKIASASVWLGPPDQTMKISDLQTLAHLLQQVRVYRRDDSYDQYAGQTCVFEIQYTDGTQLKVAAFNPFIIIDGKGYRCDYESCEALNRFANELLRR